MKTQHTPGPWKLSNVPTIENGMTSYHVFAPVSSGYVIARTGQSSVEGTLAEAQENARLLAAAPDLLEALQNARNVLAGLATGDLKEITPDSPALRAARAAIAKATGTAL